MLGDAVSFGLGWLTRRRGCARAVPESRLTCRACTEGDTSSRIRAPWPHSVGLKRSWQWLLAALLVLCVRAALADPPVMPQRLWIPGFGGLCDGGPHVCTRIDKIAFNARIDGVFATNTDSRGFAFVAPYGLSIGILERLEGGIFSQTAVWLQQVDGGEEVRWHQGPLRFALKGLLWPWRAEPHQYFAVVASFEQEARLWRFDGPNQLGLLTDLAAARLSFNKPLGLVELGLQIGVLWDWQGRYAAIEVGPRVGFHLPFLPGTKVFAEGLVRGGAGLSYVRGDSGLLGALNPADSLPRGGILSFGLATRPRRQVDFAMILSVGFGEIAPFMLTLRGPLDFSLGEGYPYPQSLVVDILREAWQWIAEQARKLPESMQQTCMLYGRDGQPIAPLGTLTTDGEHCEFQGKRFRIGDNLYPDSARRRVCLDPQASSCVTASQGGDAGMQAADAGEIAGAPSLPQPGAVSSPSGLDWVMLQRLLAQGALGPIRGQLDDQCILNEGNQQLSPIGHLSPDGKRCIVERDVVSKKTGKKLRTETQQIPIGKAVYRDPNTGRVCLTPKMKGQKDCPVALDAEHNRPLTAGQRAGYHGAIGLAHKADQYADTAKKGATLLTDPARLSTAVREAEDRAGQAAKKAVATLKDPNQAREAAREAWNGAVDTAHGAWQAAQHWWDKPTEKKLDDAAEAGGSGLLELPVAVGTTILTGGTGRALNAGVDAAEDVAKAGRVGTRLGEAADAIKDTAEGAAARVESAGYSHLPPPRTVQSGRVTTPTQRQRILEANRERNAGALVSDETGQQLVPPAPSRKGTVHSPNEAHVDHIQPRSLGGSNGNENLRVISREENLRKGNKLP